MKREEERAEQGLEKKAIVTRREVMNREERSSETGRKRDKDKEENTYHFTK